LISEYSNFDLEILCILAHLTKQMKKIFSILFCFLSCIFCFSNDSDIDSLKIVIKIAKEDSSKVNQLIELGRKYANKNPESAINFYNEAVSLADKINFPKGKAIAIKNIGNVHYNKAVYAEAIIFWKQSMAIYDSIGFKEGVANIQSNIGAVYFNTGDDIMANESYFKALKTAEEIKDSLRMATTLNNIAAVYQRKDNSQFKAKDYYLKALQIGEKLNDELDRKDIIGTSTAGLGEYYLKKDSSSLKNNSSALDTALLYFKKSLNAYKGTVDEPFALNNLGLIYQTMKEYDKAIDNQKKAFEIAKSFESADDVAISLTGLAQSYQKKGNYDLALQTFLEAENAANVTSAVYELEKIYKGISEIYGKRNDFTNGFKYQNLLSSTKDNIYKIESEQKLQGIQFGFDLNKKEGEIKLQVQEIKRQRLVRNGFIGGFAIVLLFAGVVFNQRNKISKAKKRSDELLLNILPEETAEELKATGTAKAKSFESVSVLFTDFKNFTQASELLTPEELVEEINHCYSEFDKIVTKYGIEKIKTIGDAYMCAGGLPVKNNTHPQDVIKAGLEMQQFIAKNKAERMSKGQPFFELRLGIHTGPVVAGIVGIKKFAYDIWGDTVNTASRMESSGVIGKVNISGTTYELVKDKFNCTHRGKIEAKNKGLIDMYFVEAGPVVERVEHVNAGLGVVGV
jgi:class 3 adenylate cyclase